jgi:hypothetical protein
MRNPPALPVEDYPLEASALYSVPVRAGRRVSLAPRWSPTATAALTG